MDASQWRKTRADYLDSNFISQRTNTLSQIQVVCCNTRRQFIRRLSASPGGEQQRHHAHQQRTWFRTANKWQTGTHTHSPTNQKHRIQNTSKHHNQNLPRIVAVHLNRSSPMGPALQFGGGSVARSFNSLFKRLSAIFVLCCVLCVYYGCCSCSAGYGPTRNYN